LVFIGFKALCSKTDFSYFQKKETASLFKNGHFKNVHFQKIQKQIYITGFGGNYNCGNAGHDYSRIIRFSQAWVVKIQCKHIIIIVREYIRSGSVISRIYVITT
jgi:hypothetical protein